MYNDDQTPQPLEEPPQPKKPPQTPKPQYEESTAISTYLQTAQPPKKRREDKKTHELVKQLVYRKNVENPLHQKRQRR